MYALLFLLPIYLLVIKRRSRLQTAILLLPQTLPILPCTVMVVAIAGKYGSPEMLVLLGWIMTSIGVGLLTALNAEKSVFYDVILCLLSGLGVGILLPSLTLTARRSTADTRTLQAQTMCIAFRYLGSTTGLVLVGIAFRLVFEHQLSFTRFTNEAPDMAKHATALALSVPTMRDHDDAEILTTVIQDTIRILWVAVTVIGSSVLIITGIIIFLVWVKDRGRRSLSRPPRIATVP
jgi:hypothetical protein